MKEGGGREREEGGGEEVDTGSAHAALTNWVSVVLHEQLLGGVQSGVCPGRRLVPVAVQVEPHQRAPAEEEGGGERVVEAVDGGRD